MTKRWEKLGIEDRKKVLDAVFGSWGRYMAGAEEVSIGGINVTSEQLNAMRELMERHDKYRQEGGEIEVLRDRERTYWMMEGAVREILGIWRDQRIDGAVRYAVEERNELREFRDAMVNLFKVRPGEWGTWEKPAKLVDVIKKKRKGARKKKPGESAKRGVRR